jgi:DNA-binding IclR family transcriptional regulator
MSNDEGRESKPIQLFTRAGLLLRALAAAADGDYGEEAHDEGMTTNDAADKVGIGRTHASHALNQLAKENLVVPVGRRRWKITEYGIEQFFGPIN